MSREVAENPRQLKKGANLFAVPQPPTYPPLCSTARWQTDGGGVVVVANSSTLLLNAPFPLAV
jgi:hypothetical protein